MARKKTQKEFIEEMKERQPNIEVLSEYENSRSKIKYKCMICEHENSRRSDALLERGCHICNGYTKTTKQFIEELNKINPNIEVIGEYTGAREPILVRCKIDGYEWSPQASSLVCKDKKRNKYVGCPKCGEKSRNEKISHTYEYVKEYVESFGYMLLSSEYIGANNYIIVSCPNPNHEPYAVTFHAFKDNEARCPKCFYENNRGENNPNWNPNLTDEERENRKEKRRHIEGYEEWRISVFIRDNHTCQCCESTKSSSLNIHHLESYNSCKEKRLDIDNGITLCEDCHKDFHKKYGYGNNTKEQFEEWFKNFKNNN